MAIPFADPIGMMIGILKGLGSHEGVAVTPDGYHPVRADTNNSRIQFADIILTRILYCFLSSFANSFDDWKYNKLKIAHTITKVLLSFCSWIIVHCD